MMRKIAFQNEGRESMTSLHLLQTALSLSRIKVWQRTSPQEGRGGVTGRMTLSIPRRQSSGNLLTVAAEFLRAGVNECDEHVTQSGTYVEVDIVRIFNVSRGTGWGWELRVPVHADFLGRLRVARRDLSEPGQSPDYNSTLRVANPPLSYHFPLFGQVSTLVP